MTRAALPMYDRAEIRPATDRLWAEIRDRLRAAGIEVVAEVDDIRRIQVLDRDLPHGIDDLLARLQRCIDQIEVGPGRGIGRLLHRVESPAAS